MANEHQVNRPSRRYVRATGPFDGYQLRTPPEPVLIYELNLGGAFVSFMGEPPNEPALVLQIALPREHSITVQAETVYRHQFGMAVRFVDIDADSSARLARTVDAFNRENGQVQSVRH